LLDAVLDSDSVSDEVFGFHCQQAGEKLLKGLLSDLGVALRKNHDLGALIEALENAGHTPPEELRVLDELTPYGVLYRYEDMDAGERLDRASVRERLKKLRSWVDDCLQAREAG
jgi:HEPN domain-containing protein